MTRVLGLFDLTAENSASGFWILFSNSGCLAETTDAMKPAEQDIEAYIDIVDLTPLLLALSAEIGELVLKTRIASVGSVYVHGEIRVVIQPSQDGYTSVWIRHCHRWETSPALARFLSERLSCSARCDPGEEHPDISPHSDIFLQISSGQESLFEWSEA